MACACSRGVAPRVTASNGPRHMAHHTPPRWMYHRYTACGMRGYRLRDPRGRRGAMGKRGPKPGQGGRPARDPYVKRAWERLLERVIVPRVAKELKAKGAWVYVVEGHLPWSPRRCRSGGRADVSLHKEEEERECTLLLCTGGSQTRERILAG